ncbi:MAG: hypothetical protein JWQ35_1594, partial [Bacteriovoracaceae bacterium]|nr:hypothetical protein [Bacteriovoracaceae bacterium]
MTYFNILFLWGSLTVAIPILIALWNRKQTRRENFGGFYLLRQILQSTQKRIRLLEIIKLLNRIALIILLVLVFAEPLKKEVRMSGAQEGFAFILDVGRAMQAKSSDGTTLIELQKEKVVDFLKKIPSSSQGIILFL